MHCIMALYMAGPQVVHCNRLLFVYLGRDAFLARKIAHLLEKTLHVLLISMSHFKKFKEAGLGSQTLFM